MDVTYDATTRKVKVTMTRRRAWDGRIKERKEYTMTRRTFERALAQIEITLPLPEMLRTKVTP